jgi:hypothetical protein
MRPTGPGEQTHTFENTGLSGDVVTRAALCPLFAALRTGAGPGRSHTFEGAEITFAPHMHPRNVP